MPSSFGRVYFKCQVASHDQAVLLKAKAQCFDKMLPFRRSRQHQSTNEGY